MRRHNVLGNGKPCQCYNWQSIRLVLINVPRVYPGQLDRSTLAIRASTRSVLPEDEEDSPWMPLAQERGVPAGTSGITVMACASPRQLLNEWTHDPEEIVKLLRRMRHNMLTYSVWSGNYAPDHSQATARAASRGGLAQV